MPRPSAVFIATFLSAGAWIQGATANGDMFKQHKTRGLLRGGSRRTTSTQPPPPPPPPPMKDAPVCSSFGCPDNYAPIANAGGVECRGGECSVEQCCDAMCACFDCPNNHTPIESELYELCEGGECTKEQCCEKEAPKCNDIACPDNYAPIDKAWDVQCHSGKCSVDQCCEAMCACFACPDNYIPIDDAVDVPCTNGECTMEQCCNRDDDGGPKQPHPRPEDPEPPTLEPRPEPNQPKPEPTGAPKPRPEDDNEKETCAGFGCPPDTEPREEVQHELCVGAFGCIPEQCCKPIEHEMPKDDDKASPPPPPPVYCKDFQCPKGYHMLDGVGWVECFAEVCATDECCAKDREMPNEAEHAYCSSVRCPPETHRPIEGGDTKRCEVLDVKVPPPPPPPKDGGAFSYEFMDYSYDYEFDDMEEGRGSDMSSDWGDDSSWVDEEVKREYCDHSTCCEEKEYGLWGME